MTWQVAKPSVRGKSSSKRPCFSTSIHVMCSSEWSPTVGHGRSRLEHHQFCRSELASTEAERAALGDMEQGLLRIGDPSARFLDQKRSCRLLHQASQWPQEHEGCGHVWFLLLHETERDIYFHAGPPKKTSLALGSHRGVGPRRGGAIGVFSPATRDLHRLRPVPRSDEAGVAWPTKA